jgi:hypothetical protein
MFFQPTNFRARVQSVFVFRQVSTKHGLELRVNVAFPAEGKDGPILRYKFFEEEIVRFYRMNAEARGMRSRE